MYITNCNSQATCGGSGIDSITGYSLGSNGNVSPGFTIAGASVANNSTGLDGALGIAVDALGTIYVTNNNAGTVTRYNAGVSGNTPPSATIGGSMTSLFALFGIGLDHLGNVYVTKGGGGMLPFQAILTFESGQSGNISPIGELYGPDTLLTTPNGFALDENGNAYVANSSGGNGSVTIYPAAKLVPGGDVVPSAIISGAATGLLNPDAVAVDSNGLVYVANPNAGPLSNGSVTIYSAASAASGGNVAPIATIAGFSTSLGVPTGVALDPQGNIYVTNNASSSITIYPPLGGSAGTLNESPMAIIEGTNTGVDHPTGIAIGPPIKSGSAQFSDAGDFPQ